MAAAVPRKPSLTVGELIRRRLLELQRTPGQLAHAMQIPESYVTDLLAGRRRPPVPNRSDIYDRMTRFLRLHRDELAPFVPSPPPTGLRGPRRPPAGVRKALLALCDPARVRAVTRRLADQTGDGSLEILIVQRLLDVAQGFVRRQLADEVGIRVAAKREGCSHADVRLRLIDFLDVTPASLTMADHEVYVRPRIATWDIDLETHAMKIVLRAHDPGPRWPRTSRG